MVGGLVDVAALDLGFSADLRFSFGVCAGGRDPAPGAAGDVRCRAVRGGGTRAVVSLGEGGRAFPGAVVVIDHIGACGFRVLAGTRSYPNITESNHLVELTRSPVTKGELEKILSCGPFGVSHCQYSMSSPTAFSRFSVTSRLVARWVSPWLRRNRR